MRVFLKKTNAHPLGDFILPFPTTCNDGDETKKSQGFKMAMEVLKYHMIYELDVEIMSIF